MTLNRRTITIGKGFNQGCHYCDHKGSGELIVFCDKGQVQLCTWLHLKKGPLYPIVILLIWGWSVIRPVQVGFNIEGLMKLKLIIGQTTLSQGGQFCQPRKKSATELLFHLESAQLLFSYTLIIRAKITSVHYCNYIIFLT